MPRDWTMSLLADHGAYDPEADPLWGQGSGRLLSPPRNPTRDIPEAVLPGLSRPYEPREQEPLPGYGKVPTSDPWTMGALADTANMLGYAIPGPGGAAGAVKAAPLIVAGIRKVLPAAEEAAGKGIRAYHSSPHDFERFDFSKIGTGEGAQVYGHGIYFAENPAVSGQGGEYWKNFAERFQGPERLAVDQLWRNQFDRQAAANALREGIALKKKVLQSGEIYPGAKIPEAGIANRVESISRLNEALGLLESGKPVGPRTYEVNIAARPEQMLDWDRPLSTQPQIVGQLNKAGWDLPPRLHDLTYLRQKVAEHGPDSWYADQLRGVESIAQKTGAEFKPSTPQDAAKLAEAGIPGIRYLDQGSRNTAQLDARIAVLREDLASGRGDHRPMLNRLESLLNERARYADPTSNYVIFPGNEHLIDIMKKYAIPLTAGGATMGGLAASDRYMEQ
jgi:hypothetical protein